MMEEITKHPARMRPVPKNASDLFYALREDYAFQEAFYLSRSIRQMALLQHYLILDLKQCPLRLSETNFLVYILAVQAHRTYRLTPRILHRLMSYDVSK